MNRRIFFGNSTLLVLVPLVTVVRRLYLALQRKKDVKIAPVVNHSIISAEHMNGMVRQVNELSARVKELESL